MLLYAVSRLETELVPYLVHAKWSLPDWYKSVGRYNLVTTLDSKTLTLSPHPRHTPPLRIRLET
jgi:hypothetical protein